MPLVQPLLLDLTLCPHVTALLPVRVDEDEEIIVKAMTDYWVVGKKSDQRELYVILNQKNANLIEVNGMSSVSSRCTSVRNWSVSI